MNEVIEKLQILFDSRFGLIVPYGYFPQKPNDPNLFKYGVKTSQLFGQADKSLYGLGISQNKDQAALAAVYEGIERYCYMLPIKAFKAKIKSFEQLSINDLRFSSFLYFSTEQEKSKDLELQKFVKNLKNSKLYCLADQITSSSRTPIYISAGAIFRDYEYRFLENTTNGMGAGQNQTFSEKSALYELIERDTFQYTWLTQTGLFEMSLSDICDSCPESKTMLAQMPTLKPFLKVRLAQTLIGDYSVITSIQTNNELGFPAYCVASAYRPDIDKAIAKSLAELAQIVSGHQQKPRQPIEFFLNFDNISEFDHHVDLFYYPQQLKLLGIFNHETQVPQVRFTDLKQSFDDHEIFKKFDEKNIRIFMVNMTTSEFKGLPIYVSKAVSPDLIPLNVIHRHRPLGHPRLQNLGALYEIPHPFP